MNLPEKMLQPTERTDQKPDAQQRYLNKKTGRQCSLKTNDHQNTVNMMSVLIR